MNNQERYLSYIVKDEVVKFVRTMVKDIDKQTLFINPLTNELMEYGLAMYVVRYAVYMHKAAQKVGTTIPADLKYKGD